MGVLSYVLLGCALFGLSQCYVDKTVYQYLVDNNYSSFVQLLKETHQDGILQGKGPITVFAPTNAAIGRMDPSIMATLAHNSWQKSSLIKYHLVDGFVLIPTLDGVDHIETKAGERINLLKVGHSLILNQKSRIDSAPGNDIVCTNGVIQPIDNVLLPPLYSTDNIVAKMIERDDLFQEFLMSLLLTNMTNLLEHGEYTIFAPVNEAYLRFLALSANRPPGGGQQSNATVQEQSTKIRVESLKYQIVPGARTYDMLFHGEQLFTLHGAPVNISVLSDGKHVNHAKIIHPDIASANGIIHGIDETLFPHDMLHLLPLPLQQFFRSATGDNQPI